MKASKKSQKKPRNLSSLKKRNQRSEENHQLHFLQIQIHPKERKEMLFFRIMQTQIKCKIFKNVIYLQLK